MFFIIIDKTTKIIYYFTKINFFVPSKHSWRSIIKTKLCPDIFKCFSISSSIGASTAIILYNLLYIKPKRYQKKFILFSLRQHTYFTPKNLLQYNKNDMVTHLIFTFLLIGWCLQITLQNTSHKSLILYSFQYFSAKYFAKTTINNVKIKIQSRQLWKKHKEAEKRLFFNSFIVQPELSINAFQQGLQRPFCVLEKFNKFWANN